LRAVARRIGISAPSIYAHFEDRQAILLAVAVDAFAELAAYLQDVADAHDDLATELQALCTAYLRFARERPRRYRIMFGGAWDGTGAVESGSLAAGEVTTLGSAALATVIWVGLHGLAHQRQVAPGFPWPPDVDDRLIAALTGLRPERESDARHVRQGRRAVGEQALGLTLSAAAPRHRAGRSFPSNP
jgi:AcrR family transcriptional regulator